MIVNKYESSFTTIRMLVKICRALAVCTLLISVTFHLYSQNEPVGGPMEDPPLRFSNVALELGLEAPILGVAIHGSAWGDINGDGYPDLFLGVVRQSQPPTQPDPAQQGGQKVHKNQ